MNKCFTLIAYITFIFFISPAAAQDSLKITETKDTRIFDILSLDGQNKKIKITPDYVNKKLRMSYLRDTINISNFWGVPPEIHLLNKNFIEIKYAVRGGANLGLINTMILCVNDSKLHEAIHVLKYSSWDSGDMKTKYNLKLILTGNSKSNYKLNVHIHDDVNSKQNPETNYKYNNQTILSFDKKQNVFFSVKKNVYAQIVATKTRKAKQKIEGNFPMIILGVETYYFINDKWYQFTNNEIDEF